MFCVSLRIMEASQEIQELVDGYFSQIEVVYTGFNPWHKVGDSDAAELAIIVPKEMLAKYSEMKGLGLPEGVKFWKETKLAERLRGYKGIIPAGHAPLLDILDYLGGGVGVDYSETSNPTKMRISISEI
jgi:hypothetical protein